MIRPGSIPCDTSHWTKTIRQQEKESQQAKAWDLWLDCLSEREIGKQLNVPQKTINDWINEKRGHILGRTCGIKFDTML